MKPRVSQLDLAIEGKRCTILSTALFFFLFLAFFAAAHNVDAEGIQEEEAVIEGVEEETAAEEKGEEEESSMLKQVLHYPVNRILDFFDIFRLNVGVGPGIGINLRPTKFAQLGFENYMTARAGLGKNSGFLVKRYGLAYTESEIMSMGAGLLYTGGGQRGLTEVGTTFHLLLVGGEAAIDLSELGDFFLGFATFDFKDDDWWKKSDSE